ncbi:MAG: hypothetical protein ACLS9T_00290 [Streptococcus salivarius]
MTGKEKVVTGLLQSDGKGITYAGTSGTAKSAFVTSNGNTNYFDARGYT